MSDLARKRTLADWVVNTKRQVVKLLAVVKWARDADDVQRAMNITAFLMNQNRQFDDVVKALDASKETLKAARLRNHDLLTSLDVLTTGTYQRLPLAIKENFIPPKPFTNDQVERTMTDFEDLIRYRLRMDEIVPIEMSSYTVADGRVSFHVPNLFHASVCLRGARPDDGWFFVGVEFDLTVSGDITATQEFPRAPPGPLKQMITDEADGRLGLYIPKPVDPNIPPDQVPPQPELAPGTVDAPLSRLYNYLQMMSLSYQLEILCYQAIRLRSLGWADYLKVEMSQDRKTLTATYWVRKPPSGPQRQSYQAARNPVPLEGGKLIISIEPTEPREPLLAKMALRGRTPSDSVESFGLSVKWEPAANAWAVPTPPTHISLSVNSQALDFEALLMTALRAHAQSIVHSLHFALAQFRAMAAPGVVETRENALVLRFCGEDAAVVASLDLRTGRLGMREETDLVGRVTRLVSACDMINNNPAVFVHAVALLRTSTILEDAEQKANSLGLQHFRYRNFAKEDMLKFGQDLHGLLYIRLALFQSYYLVVVVGDVAFRFATITTKTQPEGDAPRMQIADLGWVDAERVRPGAVTANRFLLDTELLKELYAYCCARVSYTTIETQLRNRGIPYAYARPGAVAAAPALEHAQFSRAVPVLCVHAADILAGVPAAEAAMANIQITPLHWWGERACQVVTSVKLKYVQPPVAPSTNTPTPLPTPGRAAQPRAPRVKPPPPRMMRPSESIVYDTQEAVVSFVSANVDTCVEEFLDQWARVSRMVVIAREVTTMAKEREWTDVRLLAFDLQTVEFAYATGYAVTISCTDDLLAIALPAAGERSYGLRFRALPSAASVSGENPHADMRELLEKRMSAAGVRALVETLRGSLPVVLELEALRREEEGKDAVVDALCKGVSWFRVLYSGRHALDVRLQDDRAMLLDGAHHLSPAEGAGAGDADARWLRPIPAFREMLLDAAPTLGAAGRVALLDAGLVCERGAVREALRALHRRVRASLAGSV
ncbi:MED14-domain-containing protein [Auricularia subglabra TFB-10046 SS5]|uniref:Mediator of RNA polymerase II transcription subunit 14 n=1 Tax=Auricularia subglabra (strain TFB-10046 / SS5) TaxID=717982 RepID=J0CZY5_AURST|nr:MED14-domain-containing protein [Auricularia subglabra TFB-10046 SS5]